MKPGYQEAINVHYRDDGMSGVPYGLLPRMLEVTSADSIALRHRRNEIALSLDRGRVDDWEFTGEEINDFIGTFREDEGIRTVLGHRFELEWTPTLPSQSRK